MPPNIRNRVILEGVWGFDKTSIAKEFAAMFDDTLIPEPSIFERSPLSVYALEYARDGRLPLKDEMQRIQALFARTETVLVVLHPAMETYDALKHFEASIETVPSLLSDPACVNRYFAFYEQVLPWAFGIVPLLLPAVNSSTSRDAHTIALEMRQAIGGQRVAQVNVVCINTNTPSGTPLILLLKRTASRGGFWQAITGGIHPGEPLPSVALRETQEETGVVLSEEDLHATQFSHSFLGSAGYPLTEYVFAADIHRPDLVHHSEEHDDMRWVSEQEARALMIYESNRQALAHALRAIKKRPTR
ncbi:MAG: hypothetical protein RL141_379 [Candidatus Parcubacteria bacterium]|jgi:8-oxo-dGTP pyrophosphatase MutT (NUDIX family)